MKSQSKIALGVALVFLGCLGCLFFYSQRSSIHNQDLPAAKETITSQNDQAVNLNQQVASNTKHSGLRPESINQTEDVSAANSSVGSTDDGNDHLTTRFAEQLKQLEQLLPTRLTMKKKTLSDVHDTPQEVLDAGARLALLKEAWLKNQSLKPQAQKFYRSCALKDQLVVSVRSLCLVNARGLTKELGLAAMDEAMIPQNIKNIADQIL